MSRAIGMRPASGDTLTGFEVAGADGKFSAAQAKIEGDTIVVTSADVAAPVAVRYAWADDPVCNLVNRAGLPAGRSAVASLLRAVSGKRKKSLFECWAVTVARRSVSSPKACYCFSAWYSRRYISALRITPCTYSRVSVIGIDSTNSAGSR